MENIPIPDEIRAQWDRQLLDDIAGLSRMTFYVARGADLTVRKLNPDLTEEELDYIMSKYKGPMERG